jgi:long-chain fatty acid transport protein
LCLLFALYSECAKPFQSCFSRTPERNINKYANSKPLIDRENITLNFTKDLFLPTIHWFLSLLLMLTVFSSSSFAAGLALYEHAAPDMGLAAAGRAASAQDASVAAGNPAGMTLLDRSQLVTGFLGIDVNIKFDVDSTSNSGGNGGSAGSFVPVASFSYVESLSPDLKLGVSVGSYFGFGVDYDNDWAGRYYSQEAEMVTMFVNPGLGYRVNDWLSIGGGFTVVYGELNQKVAINNLGPFQDDGRVKLDSDDVGYGYNLGVLAELDKKTRFGLTYRSEVELEFDDSASLNGVLPPLSTIFGVNGLDGKGKVDMEITIPAVVMFSAYHEISNRWAVMGNIGWQEQSEFGKTGISLGSPTVPKLTADRNFDDTWHYAIGTQYRIDDPWLLSVGFAYDESPVKDKYRTPDMPVDRQYRYATGIQYDLNEDVTIGAAYTFLDAGDAKIEQSKTSGGDLKGKYGTNYVNFFNVNVVLRF